MEKILKALLGEKETRIGMVEESLFEKLQIAKGKEKELKKIMEEQINEFAKEMEEQINEFAKEMENKFTPQLEDIEKERMSIWESIHDSLGTPQNERDEKYRINKSGVVRKVTFDSPLFSAMKQEKEQEKGPIN